MFYKDSGETQLNAVLVPFKIAWKLKMVQESIAEILSEISISLACLKTQSNQPKYFVSLILMHNYLSRKKLQNTRKIFKLTGKDKTNRWMMKSKNLY